MPAPTNYSDVNALRLVTPATGDLAETNNYNLPGDGGLRHQLRGQAVLVCCPHNQAPRILTELRQKQKPVGLE